jgi:hypothetical protein
VEALLTVSTPDEVRSLSQQHPVLLTTAADDALNQLADIAVEERDYDLASGLHQARLQLSSLRTYDPGIPGAAAEHAYPPAPATDSTLRREPEPVVVSALPPAAELPDELYEALLAVQTSQALGQLVQAQPVLLAPWVDVVLSDTVNQILDEGYERLAYDLEQRRELLAELRQQRASTDTSPAETTAAASAEPTEPAASEEPSGVPPATQEAIEALLIAEDEDTMAQVLLEYPVLLTDAAQEALWHLSSEARTYGDEELARYAIECRATLRKVREGLADT